MPKSKDEKGEADKKGNVNESRNAKKGINEVEGSVSRLKMDKKMVVSGFIVVVLVVALEAYATYKDFFSSI